MIQILSCFISGNDVVIERRTHVLVAVLDTRLIDNILLLLSLVSFYEKQILSLYFTRVCKWGCRLISVNWVPVNLRFYC